MADLDLATAEETARDLDVLGVRSMAIQVDVTIAKQVHQMMETVIAAWGQLDVAINSVGIASGLECTVTYVLAEAVIGTS